MSEGMKGELRSGNLVLWRRKKGEKKKWNVNGFSLSSIKKRLHRRT